MIFTPIQGMIDRCLNHKIKLFSVRMNSHPADFVDIIKQKISKEVIMYIVQVDIHVKPEFIGKFIDATLENARNSVQEAGIARFDVIRDLENPTHFILVEVYRTTADPGKHKLTDHYMVWRQTVEPMMAAPRMSTKFANVFPDEDGWDVNEI
jgi:autoinducer 2-degrading protein